MKISNDQNEKIKLKLLISLPFIFITYGILLLYEKVAFLSSLIQSPYTSLNIFLDDFIPFIPFFAWIYCLYFLFPLLVLIFIIHKKITSIDIISILVTHMLLMIFCYIIYIVFPTSAEPILMDLRFMNSDTSYSITIIKFFYRNTTAHNAFPSLHVAPLVFYSFFMYFNWKKVFWWSLPIIILIISSTVLIKFHFFVDVLGGIIIGIFSYFYLHKKITPKIINKFLQIK